MKKAPKILILAGSTRKESVHRKLARHLETTLREAGAEARFADLRDYPLPLYDGDLEEEQGRPEAARILKELAREADAFLIASPEYNGSYPAVLKNALDWISRPDPGERHLAVFRDKPAAIVTATPGPHGGVRGLKQLRELLGMMGITVRTELGIPNSANAFSNENLAALEQLARSMAMAA